jgi:hypothetical protein
MLLGLALPLLVALFVYSVLALLPRLFDVFLHGRYSFIQSQLWRRIAGLLCSSCVVIGFAAYVAHAVQTQLGDTSPLSWPAMGYHMLALLVLLGGHAIFCWHGVWLNHYHPLSEDNFFYLEMALLGYVVFLSNPQITQGLL